MKYALLALLAMASCAAPGKKMDLVLRNDTADELVVEARAGLFSKSLTLSPGERWDGWVYREFAGSRIEVRIRRK